MRHATLSLNEVLGPDGKRGYLSVKATGNGDGKVSFKPYGVPKYYEATLAEVAGFLLRHGGGDR